MCWMCDQDSRATYTRWAYDEMFGEQAAVAALHFAQAGAARATDAMWLTGHEAGPAQPPFLILIGDTVPGDTSTTATLTVGAPHTIGTTETIGDQDFYRVTLNAGETYEIGMYAYNGGPGGIPQADAYVEIYDAGGNLIVSGDGGAHTLYNNLNSGFDVLLTFTPETSGLYFVNARAYDNEPTNGTTGDTVGDYELFVQVQAPGGYTPYYDVDSPLYSIDWGTQVDGTSRNPDGAEGPRPTGNEFTGHAWNPYGITGKNVITYYFARQGEIFIDEDPTTPGTTDTIIASGFEQWEKDVYLNAFGAYSKVADLVYVEVQSRSEADFILITYEGTPGPGVSLLGRMSPPDEENEGRTEFNAADERWTEEGLAPGGFSFTTLIHELGHGHGLAHPHDNGGHSGIMHGVEPDGVAFSYTNGDFDLNQSVYTMMSYEDGWEKSPYGQAETTDPFGWLGSLMAFDVAAIQDKYGVNEEWATGNDTYVLKDANAPGTFYSCIWDAGGTDTILYSGARDTNIDLRAASLLYEFGGGGWISYAFGIHGGFTIANGVTIERATSGSGNDVLIGNDAANVLISGAGNDRLEGGLGADTLVAQAGDDTLLGGTGAANEMIGGLGNDTYYVSAVGDTLVEFVGEGTDTVRASVLSYGLRANFENLLFVGTGDFTGTGNDLNNIIIGGAGNDTLSGLGGFDQIIGQGGNDTLIGGSGSPNQLQGGQGNDTYVLTANDTIVEFVGEGIDTVMTSLSVHGMRANTENLVFTGSGDFIGVGNLLDNSMTGGAGADHLDGGLGNDTLNGQAGADMYVFTTALGAGNVDTILGWDDADRIFLDDAAFAGLATGALASGAFVIGTGAGDADDRIIYNSATGALLFDADGSGGGAAIQFATLSPGLTNLTASDFAVV